MTFSILVLRLHQAWRRHSSLYPAGHPVSLQSTPLRVCASSALGGLTAWGACVQPAPTHRAVVRTTGTITGHQQASQHAGVRPALSLEPLHLGKGERMRCPLCRIRGGHRGSGTGGWAGAGLRATWQNAVGIRLHHPPVLEWTELQNPMSALDLLVGEILMARSDQGHIQTCRVSYLLRQDFHSLERISLRNRREKIPLAEGIHPGRVRVPGPESFGSYCGTPLCAR